MTIRTSEEARRLGSIPQRRYSHWCKRCGKEYQATSNPRAQYCGSICRAKASQERKKVAAT